MIIVKHRTFPLIILYAIFLHISWGICGIIDESAYNGTALSGVHAVFGSITPYACFSVAVAAGIGLFMRSMFYGFCIMMPQQCMLFLSAAAALLAVDAGQFADGVVRSRAFILADQLPAILAATAHTMTMVRLALDR